MTLSSLIPTMPSNGIECPENRLNDYRLNFLVDLLKPVELFMGKSMASYQDSNNIKNYMDAKDKAEKEKG